MSRVVRVGEKAPFIVEFKRAHHMGADVEQLRVDPKELLRAAEQSAAETRRTAEKEAHALVERARASAEAVQNEAREAGYKTGYKAGYSEGFDAGLAKAEDLVKQAEAALDAAEGAFKKMCTDAEPRLLAIALDAAKKVASEALAADPEMVLDLIRKGIEALRDEREFSVRVDPELASIVEGAQHELSSRYALRSLEVVPDASVGDGVVVMSPHGFVDVTLASQIRNVAMAVAEARKSVAGDEHE